MYHGQHSRARVLAPAEVGACKGRRAGPHLVLSVPRIGPLGNSAAFKVSFMRHVEYSLLPFHCLNQDYILSL